MTGVVSVGCVPPLCGAVVPSLGGLGGSITHAAASAVLDVVNASMFTGAKWLVHEVMGLMSAAASPRPGASWFQKELRVMEGVGVVVLLPLLLVASIGPALRQDLHRLGRVWAVGLPVAVLAGAAASQLTGLAIQATDCLCGLFLRGSGGDLGSEFGRAMAAGAVSNAPVFVQMMVSAITVAGALLVWLEMIVRSAAVYVATLFMPLALGCYVWPATASAAKRSVEILAALISSKFVIIASLSLGLAALSSAGSVGAVTAPAVLLMAGFAPFALLRLAPVVESSAIAHLEGMSRRPGRAALAGVAAPGRAIGHPATQMLLSRLSPGYQPSTAGVGAVHVPEREADYSTSGGTGGTPDA